MDEHNLRPQKAALFNRYFILIWLIAFSVNLCQSMMNSTVTLYMNHLGYPERLSGLVGLPYAILAMLVRIFSGGLCDRRGRRPVLVCACALFSLSVWFFGCSSGLAALLLFRGLHGAGFSMAQTANNTVLVDVTPERRRQMGIGIFYVGTAIAFGVGSAIVLGLSRGGNYSPVFLFCTLMLAAGAVLTLFCNYEKKSGFLSQQSSAPVSAEEKEAALAVHGVRRFFEPKALPAGFIMLFMSFGGISLSSYVLLYAEKMQFPSAGLFFTITAVVMFVFNLGQAWLLKKLGPQLLLFLTFGLFALSMLLQGLMPESLLCYFGMGLGFGLLQGICWPVATALAVEGVPYHRRGAANSTACLMTDIGAGAGTVVFGSLVSAMGYSVSFVLLAAVLFFAAVLSVVLFRRKRGAAASGHAA